MLKNFSHVRSLNRSRPWIVTCRLVGIITVIDGANPLIVRHWVKLAPRTTERAARSAYCSRRICSSVQIIVFIQIPFHCLWLVFCLSVALSVLDIATVPGDATTNPGAKHKPREMEFP